MLTEDIVGKLDLDGFFADHRLSFDLRQGVVYNPAKTRLCLLTTDLIAGVYKALVDEAGPAWKLILKRCGQVWGERLSRRLDRECRDLLGVPMSDMPLQDFLGFVTRYFVAHGWGTMTIDIGQAASAGLVEARLENSICGAVIADPDDMSDWLICGILASLMSYLSGQELDCVQTECMSKGAPASRFIVTAAARLEHAEGSLRAGMRHEDLVASI